MIANEAGQFVELRTAHAIAGVEYDIGSQPELCRRRPRPHVNVRLFARVALVGVEEELVPLVSEDDRHRGKIRPALFGCNRSLPSRQQRFDFLPAPPIAHRRMQAPSAKCGVAPTLSTHPGAAGPV